MNIEQRLREQIAYAYQHAPAVRKLLDGAGVQPQDIHSAADLVNIPVTSKDRLIEMQREDPPFGGLLAIDADSLPHIFISPGPIYDPQRYLAASDGNLAALHYLGIGKGDRVINAFLYHLTPAGLLMDEALRAVGATVIPSGPGNTELQVMLIDALKVSGYVGTPSFLATLFDMALKFGFDPRTMALKKAFLSAEPYPPSLRARFEGEYGMKTTNAYGTADLGFVGYSIDQIPGFCVVDDLFLEVVDPATGAPVPAGEAGEVVATSFNRVYPLVRFGTGDLGALAPGDHPAAAGRQHLLGLLGRSGDAIKVRGMFLHPNQIGMAVAKVPQIKRAQAIITRAGNRDQITLRIELAPEHAGADVSEEIKQQVQNAARLKVDAVEVVEAGAIDPAQRMVKDQRKWD